MSLEQYKQHFKNVMEPFMEDIFLKCKASSDATDKVTLIFKVHGEENKQALSMNLTKSAKVFIKSLIHTAKTASSNSFRQSTNFAVWFITQTLGDLEAVQSTITPLFDVIVEREYVQEFNNLWFKWWYLKIKDVEKANS